MIGIAVEARNLDVLRRVIWRANEDESRRSRQHEEGAVGQGEELLEYLLEICMGVVQERGLRQEVSHAQHFYWCLQTALN